MPFAASSLCNIFPEKDGEALARECRSTETSRGGVQDAFVRRERKIVRFRAGPTWTANTVDPTGTPTFLGGMQALRRIYFPPRTQRGLPSLCMLSAPHQTPSTKQQTLMAGRVYSKPFPAIPVMVPAACGTGLAAVSR